MKTNRRIAGMEQLVSEVSKQLGFNIKKKTRKREYVLARHAFMSLVDEMTHLPMCDIAAPFKQDHATVVHGKKKWEEAQSLNDDISKLMKYYGEQMRPFIEDFSLRKQKEGESVYDEVKTLRIQLNKKSRQASILTDKYMRCLDAKKKYIDAYCRIKKSRDEYKQKYTELKADWELSREEKTELERLKTYL